MHCRRSKLLGRLFVALALAISGLAVAADRVASPPNSPAEVRWDATRGALSLHYHGAAIFAAVVTLQDAAGREVAGAGVSLEPAETRDDKEKVEQRLRLLPPKSQEDVKLVLRGTAVGSEETFPAETNGESQKRSPLVRTSVGLSRNLRNNAVYDRRWDWVLIGPGDGATRIRPKAPHKQRIDFAWESHGPAIELVFRPRFYQPELFTL